MVMTRVKDLCRMMLARRGRQPKLRFCLKIGKICYMFLSFRKTAYDVLQLHFALNNFNKHFKVFQEHVDDFKSGAQGIVNPVSKEIVRLEAQLVRMDEHIINLTASLEAAKASFEALQFQRAIELGEDALTASFRS